MPRNRKKIALILAGTLLLVGVGIYGYCEWQMKDKMSASTHAGEHGEHGEHDDYTCPMHPQVHSDHPGDCPVCGMHLVKKAKAEAPAATAATTADLSEVSLSPQQMVTANVTVVPVTERSLAREIRSPGKVSYDETLQSNVTSWVAGRIDRLYVAQTGQYISKGQAIAEIYSPDLVSAQQEYLTALESYRTLSRNSFAEIAQGARQLLQSARSRLKLLGVTDAQISRLDRTRRPMVDMTIYSPVSGAVMQKVAQLGQFVGQGQPLFQVADLSRVWVEAPIYEDQLAHVRLGQLVKVAPSAYAGKTFQGRISFISPVMDPQTRTARARIALANPGGKLKPEMFVEARIQVPLGKSLTIPASAVVDTGTRRVVWVESKANTFVPREVKLGVRSGDDYPVLSGLSQGERIASTGAYLIDSSSQMRSLGAGTMAGHDMSQMKPGEKMPEHDMSQMKPGEQMPEMNQSQQHSGHAGHGGM